MIEPIPNRLVRTLRQTLAPNERVFMQVKNIRSGLELAKAIRSASASQRIAIHTSDKGLLAAPVPVLCKPCRVERLLQMLRLSYRPLRAPTEEE